LSGGVTQSPLPEDPPWLRLLAPWRWYRISGDYPDLGLEPTSPGTRYLEDNDPARDSGLNPPLDLKERLRRLAGRRPKAPWSGKLGIVAVTEAWNGAVWASGFGASGSMILFGGGHNDYFGSDVHAFDLASRRWSRLTDGFTAGRPEEYGRGAVYTDSCYPDGSPLPPHTYGYVQYDPQGNDLILIKGQLELGPDVRSVAIPHLLNLDTLEWRHGPRHPSAILDSGGWSAWDSRRRIVWGNSGDDGGGNAFIGFRPDGSNPDGTVGSWTALSPNKVKGHANHCCMGYDPERDVLVVVVPGTDSVCVLDPDRPEARPRLVRRCDAQPRLREFASIEYARRLSQFVYCSAVDGGRVYSLSPPWAADSCAAASDEWQWQLCTQGGLDPIEDAAASSKHEVNKRHTFGRFRVAGFESADTAILVRHVDTPVYAMKMPHHTPRRAVENPYRAGRN
jgi:hypothetical protein